MRWYKRDPAAALEGMIGLSGEERGYYNALIDLIHARLPKGDVTDELVVKAMAERPQIWKRVKKSLISKGKVRETPDGKLTTNGLDRTKPYLYKGGFEGRDKQNQRPKWGGKNEHCVGNSKPTLKVGSYEGGLESHIEQNHELLGGRIQNLESKKELTLKNKQENPPRLQPTAAWHPRVDEAEDYRSPPPQKSNNPLQPIPDKPKPPKPENVWVQVNTKPDAKP